MKQFLVLYYAPANATEQMQGLTPEQMQESMAPWMAWMERLGDQLIDPGSPLGNAAAITPNAEPTPSQTQLTGYSIIAAETAQHAQTLCQNHPHLNFGPNCQLEIHEAIPLGT